MDIEFTSYLIAQTYHSSQISRSRHTGSKTLEKDQAPDLCVVDGFKQTNKVMTDCVRLCRK